MATVREEILANLATTVAAISIDNGFHLDVASCERFEVDGNSMADMPAAIVAALDQDRLTETSRTEEWELSARVDLHLVHDKTTDSRSTDQVLTEAAGDLYKALMSDRRRGGWAVDTVVQNLTDFDIVSDEGRETGVMAVLRIRFRHAAGDPETLV